MIAAESSLSVCLSGRAQTADADFAVRQRPVGLLALVLPEEQLHALAGGTHRAYASRAPHASSAFVHHGQ